MCNGGQSLLGEMDFSETGRHFFSADAPPLGRAPSGGEVDGPSRTRRRGATDG